MTRRVDPWPVWLVVTTATFAALETLARWSGTHPRKRHGSLVPLAFLAGAAWLTSHVSAWGGAKEMTR